MSATKGPWIVGRSGKSVMGPNGERVADCRDPEMLDEKTTLANARLIAALPDLLSALVDLLACDVQISGPDAPACVRAAREAIALSRPIE